MIYPITSTDQESKNSSNICFIKSINGLGELHIRPINLSEDISVIHDWVNREYAIYWGMSGTSVKELEAAYLTILQHSGVFIGMHKDVPVFLLECYNPKNDPVGKCYEVKEGDCGMHILIAPSNQRIHNFTWNMFTTAMDFIFCNRTIQRIVVEPDVRNKKIHILNKRAGFEYQKLIGLPNKTAHLAFCTRDQYQFAKDKEKTKAVLSDTHNRYSHPQIAGAHLNPDLWAAVNRWHISKAISEFAHELLIHPVLENNDGEWNSYVLSSSQSSIEYRFKALRLSLDHWHVNEKSITKYNNNTIIPLDALHFIQEFKDQLGISQAILPTYMEEITSTLYGRAYMLSKSTLTARELIRADYQTIEHAMTAGHPCFVANNGRIGFDTIDYRAYAPEAAQPIQLIWLAGHKSRASYNSIQELSYNKLLEQELDPGTIESFNNTLERMGLDAEEYIFLPVHPWQWFNKLAIVFAPDIATHQLVCLGYSPDKYMAQQSIRTFYNTSHPGKHYVKTALSILNMGFVRGLSTYYMSSTPAITEWIKEVLGKDAFLQKTGFAMLCEVATVGYRNIYYEELGRSVAYNKMLAALWRESPETILQPGQQLMTMAALLHIDQEGNSLVYELIKASGLETSVWIKQYLRCYLKPLLHCFYHYELVFMPHGENLILVMEKHVPVKAIMKDITEEVCLFNPEVELPEKVKRIYTPTPEDIKLLSIFTDVFDCYFRFLSSILSNYCSFSERLFWKTVAEIIGEYQEEFPELKVKFERYDLFAPEFARSCLNRLQLNNNQQMIDLSDPHQNLQIIGTLQNPIYEFRNNNS